MISSTIGELAAERRDIGDSLAAGGLADGWLFELHATSGGEPPSARYLDIAHRCDLFVIIVAGQGSEATEEEYHAAYADNPHKIMPFFVGNFTDATKGLRDVIESRHVRVHRQDLSSLASAVVAAITAHIQSGEVVKAQLIEALNMRLRRAEQVVNAAMPLSFIPMLSRNPKPASIESGAGRLPATTVAELEQHIVLEGIGGSGKTYAALAILCDASTKGRLPAVIQPTMMVKSTQELIKGALEAVRFFPGDALLQQLSRDGRFGVLVDGIDGLASDDRRIFLHDVDEFARRFPRSLIICCVRRTLSDELKSFARFTVEPLSDSQIVDMFKSVNAPQIKEFPEQVADLARWPLWAWALLEVGPNVQTGLQLLQQLLEKRIRTSGTYGPIEAMLLTKAAAAIAFRAWPQPSMIARDALSFLSSWGATTSVRSKFAVPPAETVIQRLSAAGVVQLTPDVVFAHPLFATYLAALHAASIEPMTDVMAGDPEFAMFVSALLGDDEVSEKLTHLVRHGPVGQARYLRLVSETPREPRPDDPIAFGTAVRTLSGSAAECIVTDKWTAWRTSEQPGAPATGEVKRWMSNGEVNFLPGNVFKHRAPVDVAAIESLARFKYHVTRLRPDEDRFARITEPQLKRLLKLPRQQLNELILQAAVDWRNEWRDQATRLGIATLPEAGINDGDPRVTMLDDRSNPGVSIDWGGTASVTWVQPDPDQPVWRYRQLATFLDPGVRARIYNELIDLAERALGCTFGSQAWNRPEHVAAWAW